MPTYDYECQACGHHFELFQSMTARVKRKCPKCGKRSLQRLIGPGAGFIFKGHGFYTTDYRSESYKAGKSAAEDTPKTSPESGKDKGKDSGKDSDTTSKPAVGKKPKNPPKNSK